MSHNVDSVKWKRIGFEIFKYALGVILGALGVTVSGCASVPMFVF